MSNLIFKALGAASGKKPDVGTAFIDAGDTSTTSLSYTDRNGVYTTVHDTSGNLHLFLSSKEIYKCTGDNQDTAVLIGNAPQQFYNVLYDSPTGFYIGITTSTSSPSQTFYRSTDLINWNSLSYPLINIPDGPSNYPLNPYEDPAFAIEVNGIVFFIPERGNEIFRIDSNGIIFPTYLFGQTDAAQGSYGYANNTFLNSNISFRYQILGITYKDGAYYAINQSGNTFKSFDGINWQSASLYPESRIGRKAFLPAINKFITGNLLNPEKPITYHSASDIITVQYPSQTVTVTGDAYNEISLSRFELEYIKSADSNSDGSVIVLGSSAGSTDESQDYPAVLVSVDSGITWNAKFLVSTSATRTNLEKVLYIGNNSFLVFLSDAIYKTSDNGSTWTTVLSGINIRYARIGCIKAPGQPHGAYSAIVVSRHSTSTTTFYRSDGTGENWTNYQSPWTTGIGAICFNGTQLIATSTSSTNFWSSTDGTNWTNTGISVSVPDGYTYPVSLIYTNSKYFLFTASFATAFTNFYYYSVGSDLQSITYFDFIGSINAAVIIEASQSLIYVQLDSTQYGATCYIDTSTDQKIFAHTVHWEYDSFIDLSLSSITALSNGNLYCLSLFGYNYYSYANGIGGTNDYKYLFKKSNLETLGWEPVSTPDEFSFLTELRVRPSTGKLYGRRATDFVIREFDTTNSTTVNLTKLVDNGVLNARPTTTTGTTPFFRIANDKIYFGTMSRYKKYDFQTQSEEYIQMTGSISSLAVNPNSGAVSYKIHQYVDDLASSAQGGRAVLAYPNSQSLDRIAYVKNPSEFGSYTWGNVVWDHVNSRFYTIIDNAGYSTVNTGKVAYSTDGISWTIATPNAPTLGILSSPISSAAHIFTFNPNKLIIFGGTAVFTNTLETTDGINFTLGSNSGLSSIVSSIKHPTNNRCIAYGSGIYYSDDLGTTWTKSTAPNAFYTALMWSNNANKYLAFDSGQNLYTSVDGVTWSFQVSGTTLGIITPGTTQRVNTIFETSDDVLCVMGLRTFFYTKDFTFSTQMLPITVPTGLISFAGDSKVTLSSSQGISRSAFGHYFPEGTDEKIKIFGGPNTIAVTP